jgi:hypothetical protein
LKGSGRISVRLYESFKGRILRPIWVSTRPVTVIDDVLIVDCDLISLPKKTHFEFSLPLCGHLFAKFLSLNWVCHNHHMKDEWTLAKNYSHKIQWLFVVSSNTAQHYLLLRTTKCFNLNKWSRFLRILYYIYRWNSRGDRCYNKRSHHSHHCWLDIHCCLVTKRTAESVAWIFWLYSMHLHFIQSSCKTMVACGAGPRNNLLTFNFLKNMTIAHCHCQNWPHFIWLLYTHSRRLTLGPNLNKIYRETSSDIWSSVPLTHR